MTIVEHGYNPKTGEFEIVGVVSDVLGLYGEPTIHVGKGLLYGREDLEKMGHKKKIGMLEAKMIIIHKPYMK